MLLWLNLLLEQLNSLAFIALHWILLLTTCSMSVATVILIVMPSLSKTVYCLCSMSFLCLGFNGSKVELQSLQFSAL
ncbi:hypothetical protein AMECASPLE_019742 [Ameca splendens]|uniref:Uncharacterized protein n=1 Tax=Ameca splendens TaxID=208324 RepID=A0ABV0XRZ6_9TELE